jgi:LAO/AO transport system kinase
MPSKPCVMPSPDIESLQSGNRRALAKAITLVESTRVKDVEASRLLLEQVQPLAGGSLRIGISGVPGVGKSTFIEALGLALIRRGHKVAVLAVDPSSPQTGGSILGDKTRMVELSAHPDAFIRPSPTGGVLGGVARATREAISLCEVAGYDRILVETVGVGQSEYEVASMTDLFLLLALTGAGDGLQGIKRGILEITDMLIINKADGDNKPRAKVAANEYEAALHLLHPHRNVPVVLASALNNEGIGEVIELFEQEAENRLRSGMFHSERIRQQTDALRKLVDMEVLRSFWEHPSTRERFDQLSELVRSGSVTLSAAVRRMIE